MVHNKSFDGLSGTSAHILEQEQLSIGACPTIPFVIHGNLHTELA